MASRGNRWGLFVKSGSGRGSLTTDRGKDGFRVVAVSSVVVTAPKRCRFQVDSGWI